MQAPCAGVVDAVQKLAPGDAVVEGQVLATIAPSAADGAARRTAARHVGAGPRRGRHAAGSGASATATGFDRSRRRAPAQPRQTHLPASASRCCSTRARFAKSAASPGFASYDDDGRIAEFTPANHVGGWGTIDGRTTIVCADDFTSRGGHADGAIGAKSRYLDRLSMELRVPSVRLLDGSSGGGSVAAMVPAQKKEGETTAKESSGAIKAGRPRVTGGGGSFLPGHLGSSDYAEQLCDRAGRQHVARQRRRHRRRKGRARPLLGDGARHCAAVRRRSAGGRARDGLRHLEGGSRRLADSLQERLGRQPGRDRGRGDGDGAAASSRICRRACTKRRPCFRRTRATRPIAATRSCSRSFRANARRTFDIRKAIRLMADADSFFEIGPLWGTDQVTGFVRFNGYPLGVIASDSRHVNGGALTADGCDKLTRHIDLCDVFHLPVLNLVDNPGFAVGVEHEIAGTIRKGGEWMVAFAQASSRSSRCSCAAASAWRATTTRRRSRGPRCGSPGRPPTSAASRRRAASKRRTNASSPKRKIRGAARRAERAHRKRARPGRTAFAVSDRRDDRSARHAPPRLRVGRNRLPDRCAACRARTAGVAVSAVGVVGVGPPAEMDVVCAGHARAIPGRSIGAIHGASRSGADNVHPRLGRVSTPSPDRLSRHVSRWRHCARHRIAAATGAHITMTPHA